MTGHLIRGLVFLGLSLGAACMAGEEPKPVAGIAETSPKDEAIPDEAKEFVRKFVRAFVESSDPSGALAMVDRDADTGEGKGKGYQYVELNAKLMQSSKDMKVQVTGLDFFAGEKGLRRVLIGTLYPGLDAKSAENNLNADLKRNPALVESVKGAYGCSVVATVIEKGRKTPAKPLIVVVTRKVGKWVVVFIGD
jgi:hypothetical protein